MASSSILISCTVFHLLYYLYLLVLSFTSKSHASLSYLFPILPLCSILATFIHLHHLLSFPSLASSLCLFHPFSHVPLLCLRLFLIPSVISHASCSPIFHVPFHHPSTCYRSSSSLSFVQSLPCLPFAYSVLLHSLPYYTLTLSTLLVIHLFSPFFTSLSIIRLFFQLLLELVRLPSVLFSSLLTFVHHSLILLIPRYPCLVSLSYTCPLPSFSTIHFLLFSLFHCSLALVISSARQTRLCNSVAVLSVSKWLHVLTPRSKSRREGGRNRKGGDESGRGRRQ